MFLMVLTLKKSLSYSARVFVRLALGKHAFFPENEHIYLLSQAQNHHNRSVYDTV